MKKIILFTLIFAFLCGTAQAAMTYGASYYKDHISEARTGSSVDPIYLAFNELDTLLAGTDSVDAMYFNPTTAPSTPLEGQLYYNAATDNLVYRNASAWVTLATSTSGTMDETYNQGSSIDVDTDAVTLTTSDGDDNVVLAIVQNEATNDNDAVTITMGTGAIGNALLIDSVTDGNDVKGDNWVVTQAGALTCVGVTTTGAVTISAADFTFDDTYDIMWDTSEDTLVFKDNAVLGFGNTGAAPDVEFKWNTSNLLIESAAEDTGEIEVGATNAIDLVLHANTAASEVAFNASTATAEFNGYDIQLQDADLLMFGDDDDFTIFSDTETVLEFDPKVAGNEIRFGTAYTDAVDITWYGDLSGDTVTFDEELCEVLFTDIDLQLDDSADLIFGTGDDFVLDSDTANTLDIISADTDEAGTVNFGKDANGIDVVMWAATSGNKIFWDSSEGEVFFEDANFVLNEGSDLRFEDSGGATDWTVECDGAEVLEFLPTEITDDQAVHFGDADHTSDLVWYTMTASSTINIDASEDLMYLDAVALRINDDDDLWFGDSNEFMIEYDEDGTDNLIIIASVENDAVQIGDGTHATDFKIFSTGDASAIVNFDASADTANGAWFFGASDHGVDVNFYGATASQEVQWDQSADTWYFGKDAEGVDVYFNANTTGDYVLWDEGDEDLKFVGANLVLDADSGIENPVVVVTDAAEYDVTAANSGKVHIIKDLSQNTSIDLPAEAAGLYYEFWYCGGAEEAHDHTIDSENNTNYFIGGVIHHDNDDGSVAAVSSDGNSNSKLTLSDARDGTRVKVSCDGLNWYVTGTVNSDTAPAFADQAG